MLQTYPQLIVHLLQIIAVQEKLKQHYLNHLASVQAELV